MTRNEFTDFIASLCNYFERRVPNDNTMALWFDKCRNIPAEPLRWIANQVQENEAMPKNLPQTVFAIYHRWLAEHPEKKIRKFERNCYTAECEYGLLHVSRMDDEMRQFHDYVFRCPCEHSTLVGIPIAGKQELIDRGYVFGRMPEPIPEHLREIGNLEFDEAPF